MIVLMNENTIAQELVAVEGFSLEECFHKDIIKSAIEVPDYVSSGCTLQDDGTWFDAEGVLIEASVIAEEEPVVEEEVVEEVAEEPAAEEPAAEEPAE